MADNVQLPVTGTGTADVKAATDEVTYSGETAQLPLGRMAHVAGAEGSKTVEPITGTIGAAAPAAGVALAGTDGTNLRLLKTDASGEAQVDVLTLPAIPAGNNNIGDVDVLTVPADPFGVNADAASATGSISAKLRSLLEAASTMNASSSDGGTALTSTAQAIKASAGTLMGYYIYNPNAAAVFVQFYNTASGSVTVGTTNPLFMLTIPAASAANLFLQPGGVAFGTAMSWSATSTAGGNGAPTTALDAVCWYK